LILNLLIVGCVSSYPTIKPSTEHLDIDVPSQRLQDTNIPPIVTSTYLPPPQALQREEVYSVVVYDVSIREMLFAIARDNKLNIDVHPEVKGRVTLNVVEQTLPAILERLSEQVPIIYNVKNNTLIIKPDWPQLRTYKVDYVNMSRETQTDVGVASEIGTAGKAATIRSSSGGGANNVSNSTGAGGSNNSKTIVKSYSSNQFWKTLVEDIKDLLRETDKEVRVTHNNSESNTKQQQVASDNPQQDTVYSTLFAATVIAHPETGLISVRATQKQHEKVQEFLEAVMLSAKRQVLIEATIVEVRLNKRFQAGIDWSKLGSPGGAGFVFSQTLGPQIATSVRIDSINAGSNPGLVAGYFNSNNGFSSSVQLLEQFGSTKVLSSPKLMVMNNQTALLKVVDNLVYFTATADLSPASVNSGALIAVTTTPHTVPVGVVMSVTPQITEQEDVNINVRPNISQILTYVRDPSPNLTSSIPSLIPQIRVQEMESLLQVRSGGIAVLGGLMQDQTVKNYDQVPGLGNIPGIGTLFRSRDEQTTKTELVIFLRPTVIRNASLDEQELARYKQYFPSRVLGLEATSLKH
ncbi:MAG: pilus (MSHA type) biogenesis protein MshL, partial [Methylophilaceae bacterium]|nr:pilus (MSHA type) biogenesis protein MshL [Methylophilaceae bacterium]